MMKFVRYFLAIIISLLAVYGGYQLYVQHTDQGTDPDEFAREMRDLGFEVGEGDSGDVFSSVMQSDLGTPSGSFGMGDSASVPGSLQQGASLNGNNGNATGYNNGLPSSLRRSGDPPNGLTSSPNQTTPPGSNTTIIFSEQGNGGQGTTLLLPPQTPGGQQSGQTQPGQTQPGISGIYPGDGMSQTMTPLPFDRDIEHSTPPNSAPGNQLTTTAQTLLPSDTVSFGTTSVQQDGIAQSQPDQTQADQTPVGPSPYTYGVATGPTDVIDTTVPSREPQAVVIAPVTGGATQVASLDGRDLSTCQPIVAANPHVHQLPPIETDPTLTASVAPPVFIPRLSVTALPPVEEEIAYNTTYVADASLAAVPPAPDMTFAPQDAPTFDTLQLPPQVQTHPVVMMMPPEQGLQPLTDPMRILPMQQQQQLLPQETPQVPVEPPMVEQQIASPVQEQIAQEHVAQQPATLGGVTPLPQSQNGETVSDISPQIANQVAEIGNLLSQNQVTEAYEQLSNLYFYGEMTPQEHQYVAKHLDQLAGGLLFSKRHHVLEPAYTVREGDTIESIALQYKITPELLRKLNGLSRESHLTAGSQLKVIRGPLDARIYPGRHELVVVTGDKYACRFPISVGSGYAGQSGSFTVQDKALDRAYQIAHGMTVIPPGDPNNPLGSRWIELSKEQGTIGVHGTNQPQTIGTTRLSAGIFGLREQDIAEVYDMLIVGSNVTIVR